MFEKSYRGVCSTLGSSSYTQPNSYAPIKEIKRLVLEELDAVVFGKISRSRSCGSYFQAFQAVSMKKSGVAGAVDVYAAYSNFVSSLFLPFARELACIYNGPFWTAVKSRSLIFQGFVNQSFNSSGTTDLELRLLRSKSLVQTIPKFST